MIPLVGLTGGAAAGKSEARRAFAALGVPTLDLDAVGRRLLDDDAEVRAAVLRAFPEAGRGGRIDRARLAARVFTDRAALRRLEAILHPRIWAEVERWRQRLADAPYALIEASALIESGATDRVDALVVVLAPLALRRARALRRGWSARRFEKVVAAQCDDDARRAVADFVIVNDRDDPAALAGAVREADRRLRAMLGCACSARPRR